MDTLIQLFVIIVAVIIILWLGYVVFYLAVLIAMARKVSAFTGRPARLEYRVGSGPTINGEVIRRELERSRAINGRNRHAY